jgi:myosin-like protein
MLILKTVLHTIQNRYAQHSIYTYSGIVLIAVNPFQRVTLYGPEIIQAYSGRKRGELEPHLFAIAEDAYTAMQKEGMGQTIIVSGERYCFTTLTFFKVTHPSLVVQVKRNRSFSSFIATTMC